MTLRALSTYAARGNRHAARLLARHRARQAIAAAGSGLSSEARRALDLAKHWRAYSGASAHITRRASAALARAGIRH